MFNGAVEMSDITDAAPRRRVTLTVNGEGFGVIMASPWPATLKEDSLEVDLEFELVNAADQERLKDAIEKGAP